MECQTLSMAARGDDARHLGMLVGDPKADRIIALSTSAVFGDRSLLRIFWHTDDARIDSGIQGHLYTRPNDVFVICVPADADAVADKVSAAIDVNHEIWGSLTGIELASSRSRIVLASDRIPDGLPQSPQNMTWHLGSLLQAAGTRYRASGESFLAFVLDVVVAEQLGLNDEVAPALMHQARATTRLMDKNSAMEVLQGNGVDCATTYTFDVQLPLDRVLTLPDDKLYVFKPAGGAAGIGVFTNDGHGANARTIHRHVSMLQRQRKLPRRFQVQEFLRGPLLGASACLGDDGEFGVLEVHRQTIDADGRFVGARWSRSQHAAHMKTVTPLYWQLAAIGGRELPAFSRDQPGDLTFPRCEAVRRSGRLTLRAEHRHPTQEGPGGAG